VLALESDLRRAAMDGGQALEFTDGAGQRVLRYDHLVVRGADDLIAVHRIASCARLGGALRYAGSTVFRATSITMHRLR
jgi:hypothetical protein